MITPTLRAIPCSERMPTREDADKHGHVIAGYRDPQYADWLCTTHWAAMHMAEYWFPLNRSAIVTPDGKEGE